MDAFRVAGPSRNVGKQSAFTQFPPVGNTAIPNTVHQQPAKLLADGEQYCELLLS